MHHLKAHISVCLLLVVAFSFLCNAQKTELIQLADGTLKGLVKEGFRVFFGIPYAVSYHLMAAKGPK